MSVLDRLIPKPALVEIDRVEVAAPADGAWEAVRDLNLARSAMVRTLFGLRTSPDRPNRGEPQRLRLADLISTLERPGFQMLGEDPLREVAAGAIGKIRRPSIAFVHVPDATAFAAFSQGGHVKVAWALRVVPESDHASRIELELRAAGTDDRAWKGFVRYFRLIGPASHFMRRVLLAELEDDLGTPDGGQNARPLPGDELVPDAIGQFTHSIVIAAAPGKIWPWLVQMGCQRTGLSGIDTLDDAGVPRAREIRLDLRQLRVGDAIPTRSTDDHFEILRIEENRALVLGGLFDVEHQRRVPFAGKRPRRYWHVSWAFVLEPLDTGHSRLYARARGAFSPTERLHAFWIDPIHHLMQPTELRKLAARAEGRLPRQGSRVLGDIAATTARSFILDGGSGFQPGPNALSRRGRCERRPG